MNESRYVRAEIDGQSCQGHGECLRIAPELFDLDDDLTAHCAPTHPLSELGALQHAMDSCPQHAIKVEVVE